MDEYWHLSPNFPISPPLEIWLLEFFFHGNPKHEYGFKHKDAHYNIIDDKT